MNNSLSHLLLGILVGFSSLSPRVISDKRPLPGNLKQLEKEAARAGNKDIYNISFDVDSLSFYTGNNDSVSVIENKEVPVDSSSENNSDRFPFIPKFTGFDKSVNSSKESFFITNPHEDTLLEITFEITYLTMKGEMLHKREVTEKITIPSNETRRIDITSWDIQHQFYYHRTAPTPKRTATPFKVRFRPITASYTSTSPK